MGISVDMKGKLLNCGRSDSDSEILAEKKCSTDLGDNIFSMYIHALQY